MASTSSFLPMPASITWEIDNFVSLNKTVMSKNFSFQTNEKIKCNLILDSACENDYLGESTSIILNLVSPSENVTLHSTLWIINSNGDKCMKQEASVKYVFKVGYVICGQFHIWNKYLLDSTNGLLTDGKLIVCCEVKIIENNGSISGRNLCIKDTSKLAADLKLLLENEFFSDVVLVVGEKEFRVHKAILSARSSVFKAMFEHDCEEKNKNRVEIIDLEVEVCEEFLRYLYTGNIESLDQIAPELMAVADKYQLDELKSICEQFLCESLDINSVASVLQLADMHNAEQLKSKCIEYITANAKDVQDTEGWKKLFIAKPELGFQLFLNVANRK